ncbi:unnamed protein product [Brassica rapa]|uniref:NYN domain-containing protein n=2 Tax=Brassica TaxID=3705 RepID=A0A8D9LQR7_BRACM|nr:unnamed protein product [Brassica napus]CAG7883195.1 unnamed protein product [Brassica rapa]
MKESRVALYAYFLRNCAGNTGVFLDVDDFPIPKHLDPKSIYQKIKRALENKGYRTHVSLRLYGDKYAEAGIKICLVPDVEGVTYTRDENIGVFDAPYFKLMRCRISPLACMPKPTRSQQKSDFNILSQQPKAK